jgi:hypothetical protein
MRVLSTMGTFMILTSDAGPILAHRLTIYLPDRNGSGSLIPDIEEWAREGLYLLTTICGGATRLAPARGMWFNNKNATLIEEITHIVFAYVDPATLQRQEHHVVDFLRRFGRETSQDAVAVEFDGKLCFIADYRTEIPTLHVVS